MTVVPVESVFEGLGNVPIEVVIAPDLVNVAAVPGASRYRCLLDGDRPLDALLLNRESEFLVVSLHGAVGQKECEAAPLCYGWVEGLIGEQYALR